MIKMIGTQNFTLIYTLEANNIMSTGQILTSVYHIPSDPVLVESIRGYQSNILILIPDSPHWEEEKAYLVKMFESAGQGYETDFNIIRIPSNGHLSWVDLIRSTPVQDVYLFGVHPKQLGLQSDLVAGMPVQCGDRLIFRADTPLKVENNKDMRLILWNFFQNRYLNAAHG